METLIVKENGNETVKSNLRFRAVMNKSRYDGFIYEKYSQVKERIETLRKIFKHSSFEILIVE